MTFFWPQPLSPAFSFQAQTFYPKGNVGIWADFPSEITLLPENQITLDSLPPVLPRICKRIDSPSLSHWQALVLDAQQKIAQGSFQKVVLARQTTLIFNSPINPQALLKKLLPLQSHATLFMIQLDSCNAFLGATPEKLFTRHGKTLWTEAVAGTISEQESWSPKEQAEFDLIIPYLEQKLRPFCSTLLWGKTQERRFGSIRHLSQQLKGTLSSSFANEALIQALHPTPALAGFPSAAAVDYIRSVEPFDRGLYGAPIGFVSTKEADIAVAIRSLLVQGKKVHLFAGAGIVLQSSPLKEWEELDRKIAHVLECFL